MTSVMGRPREHDRAKIAEALLEWAAKPSSINLCEFCAQQMIPGSKISEWAKQDTDFRETYELAKHFIGARREQMLNGELLHVKAYDLNARTYDHFLKEDWKESLSYEHSLKVEKPEDEEKTREAAAAMREFTDVIKAQRALKIDEIKSNAESKS